MSRLVVMATAALLCGAVGFAAASEEDLRAEVAELRRRADALEAQRSNVVRRDVERYLVDVAPHAEAQGGGGLHGLTLHANVTGVFLATVGSDPGDTHSVHGDVELDFDFAVTENLNLFVDLTANSNGAAFPAAFGPIAGPGGATLSGLVDGIGVDGTVSTAPGSVAAEQWGATWTAFLGDHAIEITGGRLDPREYYATNAFAGDSETQFLNNIFDDPPAIDWPTNASGTTIYGLRCYTQLGPKKQYSIDVGWFNMPGQWFNAGILFAEFAWKGRIREREFHLRVYGQLNCAPADNAGGLGVSFDWYATEKIGIFARATLKDNQQGGVANHPNQVESDWQVGAVFFGPIRTRPDDEIGVAFGYIKGPIDAIIPGAPENNEMIVEVYYKLMLEGGKLQVTAVGQYVADPAAGTFPNGDDLILVGMRVHVPF
jgi:hypothetical protein